MSILCRFHSQPSGQALPEWSHLHHQPQAGPLGQRLAQLRRLLQLPGKKQPPPSIALFFLFISSSRSSYQLAITTLSLYMSQTTSFLAAWYFFIYFFCIWGLTFLWTSVIMVSSCTTSQLPSFVLLLLSLFWVLQHGSDECLLNTIDACTISIYPDVVSSSSMPQKKEAYLTHRSKPK